MFGAQCFELVPGLNVIGFFSNFAAAALWAAQIDNEAALEDFGQVICTFVMHFTHHVGQSQVTQ